MREFVRTSLISVTFLTTSLATELVLQPGPEAGRDSYVSSKFPNTNYGASPNLKAGLAGIIGQPDTLDLTRSFLQFDLSAIPDAAQITIATLHVYVDGAFGTVRPRIAARRIAQSWDEAAVTRANQPGVSTTALDTKDFELGTQTWGQWDVTGLVKDWLSGAQKNYGVALVSAGELESVVSTARFLSSDAAEAAMRPKLVIEYEGGGSGDLQVNIAPAEARTAGAQWRVDGGAWRNSDDVARALSVGEHQVEFKKLTCWQEPAAGPVTIKANQTTMEWVSYLQLFGAVRVVIEPQAARAAGALWQLDGGAWRNSGDVVELAAGPHRIAYKKLDGWEAPPPETVEVPCSATVNLPREYTPDFKVWQVQSLNVDSALSFRCFSRVDTAANSLRLKLANPCALYRRFTIQTERAAGFQDLARSDPPVRVDTIDHFLADVASSLTARNLIGPDAESDEYLLPLEDGMKVHVWVQWDALLSGVDDLRAAYRGDGDPQTRAGMGVAKCKTAMANLIRAGLIVVGADLGLAAELSRHFDFILGKVELAEALGKAFHEVAVKGKTPSPVEFVTLLAKTVAEFVGDNVGGLADDLAKQMNTDRTLLRGHFQKLGKALSVASLVQSLYDALRLLYDAATVPEVDLSSLRVVCTPAGLGLIGAPEFSSQLRPGDLETIVTTVENVGQVSLLDVYADLRLIAVRGDWGSSTGTGLPNSVVESFEDNDPNTVLEVTADRCSGELLAPGHLKELVSGCRAQFSRRYIFDHSKHRLIPQPFLYRPGMYSWALQFHFAYEGPEGRTAGWTEIVTGEFELRHLPGSTPTPPEGLSVDRAADNLLLRWSPVRDYDVSEYHVLSSARGAESWQTVAITSAPISCAVIEIPTTPTEFVVRAVSNSRGTSDPSNRAVYSFTRPILAARFAMTKGLEVELNAASNESYRIEASHNLEFWVEVGAVTTDAAGSATLLDTDALGTDHRFYRARLASSGLRPGVDILRPKSGAPLLPASTRRPTWGSENVPSPAWRFELRENAIAPR